MITVLYFAAVRERLKLDSEAIPTPPTVEALLDELLRRHPTLAGLRPALKVAVNQAFVPLDHRLNDGDEVALIPPVSGGAPHIRITENPLSLDEVVRAVSLAAHGGIATFTGVVRAESRGKKVVRLEYEAYRPMAERELARIAQGIESEWPGARVAMVHRLGTLAVGEAAVVIAASAPHRAVAFDACRAAIDRLKQSVPIWKKEIFEDGEVWVGLGP
jgi:molybdopterin synthase catalytic subunit